MKSVVSPFGTSTNCLRIVCTGGLVIRVTQHPTDLLMTNGVLYQTGSGFDFTGLESAASLSPSAIDLEGILGFAGVTRERLASGVFDGSRAYLFACDYLNPVEDHEPIVEATRGLEVTDLHDRLADPLHPLRVLGRQRGRARLAEATAWRRSSSAIHRPPTPPLPAGRRAW